MSRQAVGSCSVAFDPSQSVIAALAAAAHLLLKGAETRRAICFLMQLRHLLVRSLNPAKHRQDDLAARAHDISGCVVYGQVNRLACELCNSSGFARDQKDLLRWPSESEIVC